MNITVTKTTHPGTLPPADTLGFGSVFTDHMFVMDYTEQAGWHDARIVPYGPLSLSPAASVLHYGTEVFEGMKAYRRPDGGVQLFRPWDNVERLNKSCDRLSLPQLDPDDALEAIRRLVEVDQDWVPSAPGTSLYIRPFLFSTDPDLALHGVHQAMFVVILSPVGSYFKNGLEPVKIMVETEDVRAVRGGTGEAKCGGNYGAANRAGDRAIEKGFSQVLWLDGVERKYVEEGGGMNVMFKIAGKVVTPMLTGSILNGVTRRSCIALLKSWGMPVEERLLSVDELFDAAKAGTLEEAWCVGRCGLPHRRAVLSGAGLCGQRRPHRRAVPEAVRRADGYPVGQAGRSLRLDVPRINKRTSMCVYEYPQGRKALGVPGVPGQNEALRNGVENCIMCPSAERTRRRNNPEQSARTGKKRPCLRSADSFPQRWDRRSQGRCGIL